MSRYDIIVISASSWAKTSSLRLSTVTHFSKVVRAQYLGQQELVVFVLHVDISAGKRCVVCEIVADGADANTSHVLMILCRHIVRSRLNITCQQPT